ncbi:reverse transcriptase [Plakobranchus ocellatus]|uniref:Reverse transcriptase n=1 Tax=Plakobranchus ocellatus TaxID=259542 RepID=A0AAV4CDE7_9GAST|nr:reverse transcriptase [Plakobranchus ocellatus]
MNNGCDDWVVSADLPEWERHPDIIRKTALRFDIVVHSASTQQIIMVELTVPYESRMEEAHAFKFQGELTSPEPEGLLSQTE